MGTVIKRLRIFLKAILEKCPFLRVAMSQVPCLHEHLANAATASSYAASVMVRKAEMEEKNMNSTALGAGAEKAQELIFISEAHEKFYYEKLCVEDRRGRIVIFYSKLLNHEKINVTIYLRGNM